MARFQLALLCGLLAVSTAFAKSSNVTLKYAEVINFVRDRSDPDVIPIDKNDARPVDVSMKQSLLYIIRVDEQADLIELVVRQEHSWRNKALGWEQSNPQTNVDNVTIPLRYLWSPDLTPTTAVNFPELMTPETAVVSSDGLITYEPQVRLLLHADLSGLQSPAGANITFTYLSWSYDNTQLTLAHPVESCFTTEDLETRKFDVTKASVNHTITQARSTNQNFDALNFSFILKKL